MSFFSTLSKAAPTLARAGQIGTAGQVFANSGLVGLAGSAVMQYI